jgi:hypothetical protein
VIGSRAGKGGARGLAPSIGCAAVDVDICEASREPTGRGRCRSPFGLFPCKGHIFLRVQTPCKILLQLHPTHVRHRRACRGRGAWHVTSNKDEDDGFETHAEGLKGCHVGACSAPEWSNSTDNWDSRPP